MIEHWSGTNDVVFEQFRLHTKHLDPPLEERWATHNAALRRASIFNSRAKNQNSAMGSVFHACGYDALVASGIQIERILCHIDATNGKHADCDFVIMPTTANSKAVVVMVKSSLKERWKQFDRDAMLAHTFGHQAFKRLGTYNGSVDIWCIFGAEDNDTPKGRDSACAEADRKLMWFSAPVHLVSVWQFARMADFFATVSPRSEQQKLVNPRPFAREQVRLL